MKLLNGDCLDLLKDIPSKSVDVLYTDPPYIPPEHSKTLTKYKKTLSEMVILESFYKRYLEEIDRVLKDDGMLLFIVIVIVTLCFIFICISMLKK